MHQIELRHTETGCISVTGKVIFLFFFLFVFKSRDWIWFRFEFLGWIGLDSIPEFATPLFLIFLMILEDYKPLQHCNYLVKSLSNLWDYNMISSICSAMTQLQCREHSAYLCKEVNFSLIFWYFLIIFERFFYIWLCGLDFYVGYVSM